MNHFYDTSFFNPLLLNPTLKTNLVSVAVAGDDGGGGDGGVLKQIKC